MALRVEARGEQIPNMALRVGRECAEIRMEIGFQAVVATQMVAEMVLILEELEEAVAAEARGVNWTLEIQPQFQ